jgi:hypothetical protein
MSGGDVATEGVNLIAKKDAKPPEKNGDGASHDDAHAEPANTAN